MNHFEKGAYLAGVFEKQADIINMPELLSGASKLFNGFKDFGRAGTALFGDGQKGSSTFNLLKGVGLLGRGALRLAAPVAAAGAGLYGVSALGRVLGKGADYVDTKYQNYQDRRDSRMQADRDFADRYRRLDQEKSDHGAGLLDNMRKERGDAAYRRAITESYY